MTSRLAVRGLSFRHRERRVLEQVSLDLAPGNFAALLGANGAGKTTLIRCMLGFLRPDEGMVMLNDTPLAKIGRRAVAREIAYVPQSHSTVFPFTVREMVAMGRTPSAGLGNRLTMADHAMVDAALNRLGMGVFAERSFAELSGGERQAVLIARAVAQQARILIMDEPAASLDIGQQIRLMQMLQALSREGYAILMSVHQPSLALEWCNRAILLHAGAVLADGEPAQVITGASLSTLYGIDLDMMERTYLAPSGNSWDGCRTVS